MVGNIVVFEKNIYFEDGRGYFYCTKGTRTLWLHREVYKKYKGDIPQGYHIHHKDRNPRNNEPWNLIALSPKVHRLLHKILSIFPKRRHKDSKPVIYWDAHEHRLHRFM